MKIVCISDTHNHHHVLDDNLPDGDMLIHAGDVAIHGSVAEIQEFLVAVNTNEPMATGFAEAHQMMKVVDASLESAAGQKPVKL